MSEARRLALQGVLCAIGSSVGSAIGACGGAAPAPASNARRESAKGVRLVAFDGLVLFDPRPVLALVRDIGQEAGTELVTVFRNRLFEYQWLRALGGRYRDFSLVAGDALSFAGAAAGVAIASHDVERLQAELHRLRPWPDVAAALLALRQAGLQVAILSNMTPRMLHEGVHRAQLEEHVDFALSTGERDTFKPHPSAYAMAMEATGYSREEILFVAFAGWDASGAAWFGYPTFWVNRLGAPSEHLGAPAPVGSASDLTGLLEYVTAQRAA